MVNQLMLDYIKSQLQKGVGQEQIKTSLIANNWQVQDIEEGFNLLKPVALPEQYVNTPTGSSNMLLKVSAGILVAAIVLGGGVYIANKTILKSNSSPVVSNETLDNPPTNTTAQTIAQPTSMSQEQNSEIVFADNLSSCVKSKTTFKHLFTGETLEKEISGLIDEKCVYVEQMPNNGKMECKYSESERLAVAQYYKDVFTSGTFGTSIQVDSERQQTKYTIGDKEVENPLAEAMASGVCVVSGY